MWNSSQEVEESGEGGETSKRNNSQSDSPQGPLQLPCTTTTTCGDSSMEDAEDAKSERRYWDLHKSQGPFSRTKLLIPFLLVLDSLLVNDNIITEKKI